MSDASGASRPATAAGYQFGTFKGVFTPSILTILGVVMYLRFGWVLGNLGLPGTLAIVTAACFITFVTGLSLSTLATNMKVGGGGAYYIISRSLGIEAGSAIGVPLYFAQTLGIAFYIAGFAEAFTAVVPGMDPRLVATITLVVLALLATFSANLAMKAQYVIMAAVALSLVSFFMGGPPPIQTAVGAVDATLIPDALGFWVVFAVFFPAVTGIEAGISMSGDLKSPARSLPLGTLGAIAISFLIYLAIPIYMASIVQDLDMLRSDTFVMRRIARWGSVVVLGVWAASLSSALGALMGAPRTLQALARDRVIPSFIGAGSGKSGDPRRATAISFGIALVTLWLGDLNIIAPILTMFFLTSYGLLNISAALEQIVGSPSWRPKFKIPSLVPLIGAFACFATMFMINSGATFVAAFVAIAIFLLMKKRNMDVHWGDMRYGLFMLLARRSILTLSAMRADSRTWTPNILVLSGSPTTRWHLIELANAVAGNEGCLTVAALIPTSAWTAEKEESLTKSIRQYLSRRDVEAIVKILPAETVAAGAEALIRAYGFGPIVPNTLMLGISDQKDQFSSYGRLVNLVSRCRRNIVLVRESDEPADDDATETASTHVVDVWWRGDQRNIGFMLALAELLRRSHGRRKMQIRLKTIVDADADVSDAEARLAGLVDSGRIAADPIVIQRDNRPIFEILQESSADADLVILGMRAPTEGDTEDMHDHQAYAYYETLLGSIAGLPTTALVLAAEEIRFDRMFGIGARE
ncbi:MAG: solute carrier family 12 sodium/potassium/chloride transporter 2 [Kiritimatiellia bacterium]|jgi:solute carrier family 12 sodium/potassium/chloride transporter 2